MIPTHYCLKCSKHHSMHYTIATTGKSLVVECPKGQFAIPFVGGLNILTRESKRFQKLTQKKKQIDLDFEIGSTRFWSDSMKKTHLCGSGIEAVTNLINTAQRESLHCAGVKRPATP